MSTTLTIELPVHFRRCGHGSRKELRPGVRKQPPNGLLQALGAL